MMVLESLSSRLTLITRLCGCDARQALPLVGHRDWDLRHRSTVGFERAPVLVVSVMSGCRADRFAVGFERARWLFATPTQKHKPVRIPAGQRAKRVGQATHFNGGFLSHGGNIGFESDAAPLLILGFSDAR